MRVGSHFDGHQTTGYNRPKNITKLEVFDRIIRCVSPNRCSRRCWAVPPKRWYVDRLSICGGAGFVALTGAQPFGWLGRRSIPLPHLREWPRAKGKMLTEREPMVLHSTKWSCSPDE
ncbi:hypothetical protein [Bradyrhizobium genosp. SA-3]|uniref:hypothetical protein n=1 Tax=Bradyrhizobium genosp. SA-3 TaxID=508868 RepID=UPI001028CE58|nr:hypothetical protein [Bradyrhizobium genosp. SA-3]